MPFFQPGFVIPGQNGSELESSKGCFAKVAAVICVYLEWDGPDVVYGDTWVVYGEDE